jgi:hypothetical protein
MENLRQIFRPKCGKDSNMEDGRITGFVVSFSSPNSTGKEQERQCV